MSLPLSARHNGAVSGDDNGGISVPNVHKISFGGYGGYGYAHGGSAGSGSSVQPTSHTTRRSSPSTSLHRSGALRASIAIPRDVDEEFYKSNQGNFNPISRYLRASSGSTFYRYKGHSGSYPLSGPPSLSQSHTHSQSHSRLQPHRRFLRSMAGLLGVIPLPPAIRRRPYLLLLLIILPLLYIIYHLTRQLVPYTSIEPLHRHNALLYYLPTILHPLVWKWVPTGSGHPSPLEPIDELLHSTWPGLWPVPELRGGNRARISVGVGAQGTPVPLHQQDPAWVSIYIFSTSSPSSRSRRDLIRMHHPALSLPLEYRHLLDVTFVLGRPEAKQRTGKELREMEANERDIEKEMEKYGDVLRLNGLQGGDNINQGKTWEWIRWVGNKGREAQWVL